MAHLKLISLNISCNFKASEFLKTNKVSTSAVEIFHTVAFFYQYVRKAIILATTISD